MFQNSQKKYKYFTTLLQTLLSSTPDRNKYKWVIDTLFENEVASKIFDNQYTFIEINNGYVTVTSIDNEFPVDSPQPHHKSKEIPVDEFHKIMKCLELELALNKIGTETFTFQDRDNYFLCFNDATKRSTAIKVLASAGLANHIRICRHGIFIETFFALNSSPKFTLHDFCLQVNNQNVFSLDERREMMNQKQAEMMNQKQAFDQAQKIALAAINHNLSYALVYELAQRTFDKTTEWTDILFDKLMALLNYIPETDINYQNAQTLKFKIFMQIPSDCLNPDHLKDKLCLAYNSKSSEIDDATVDNLFAQFCAEPFGRLKINKVRNIPLDQLLVIGEEFKTRNETIRTRNETIRKLQAKLDELKTEMQNVPSNSYNP